jgi:hypothetical protein
MRVIKQDASEYQAGRTYVDLTPCFAIKDTIELDFEDEFLKFCFKERLVGTWGDCNIRDIPEIIEAFLKSKGVC